MNRKPLPATAARLVAARLSDLGKPVSARQAQDLVALVEGYPNWQALRAASPKKPLAPEPEVSAYVKAWRVVSPAILDRMSVTHDAIQSYFGGHLVAKGMTLHAPILDTDADEFSGWFWLEDAEGRSLLTFTLTLVGEDDSDASDQSSDGKGFALRFELEAPVTAETLMTWVPGPLYAEQFWTPLSQLSRLTDSLLYEFSAAEVAYAIENSRVLR